MIMKIRSCYECVDFTFVRLFLLFMTLNKVEHSLSTYMVIHMIPPRERGLKLILIFTSKQLTISLTCVLSLQTFAVPGSIFLSILSGKFLIDILKLVLIMGLKVFDNVLSF